MLSYADQGLVTRASYTLSCKDWVVAACGRMTKDEARMVLQHFKVRPPDADRYDDNNRLRDLTPDVESGTLALSKGTHDQSIH